MRWIPASFLTHRWTGLVFGIAALLWAGSAMVLVTRPYGDYPTPEETYGALGPALSAPEVAGIAPPPARGPGGARVETATLHRLGGLLVWRAQLETGEQAVLDARTGEVSDPLTADQATAVAIRAVGLPLSLHARTEIVTEPNVFYQKRPLPAYRVSFDDPKRTDVYLEPETAALTSVVSTQERRYRIWGTMPHYSQFPPLDRIKPLNHIFRAVGLTAFLLSTVSGLVYGIWLLRRRAKTRTAREGRAQTARAFMASAHNWLGIAVCVILIAWIGSGYLLAFWPEQGPTPLPDELARVIGAPADQLAYAVGPAAALAAAAPGREVLAIRSRHYLDRPVYDVTYRDGTSTMVDGITGVALAPLPDSMLRTAAARFVNGTPQIAAITKLDRYDTFYYAFENQESEGLRLPVYRIDFENPGAPTPVYFDAYTGELLARVDNTFRTFRWLGRAAHAFEFPFFLEHPRLRRAAILIPSLLSVILASTGLWLGVLHLAGKRKVKQKRAQRAVPEPARQTA